MFRHLTIILTDWCWKGLLLALGVTAAAARIAVGDPEASTLDDDWYVTVARAESLLAGANTDSEIDSVEHAAVAEQIRLSVYVLGSLVHASISADTLIAGPGAPRTDEQPRGGWRNRFLTMTRVVGGATSLLSLAASLRGVSPGTQRLLAYIGGSMAGLGSIFQRSNRNPSSDPTSDSIARIRTVGLESDLHDSIQQTERSAESLWQDLRGLALDSCATDDQVISLARRYVNALAAASEVFDSGLARSSALARSCAEHPGYAQKARERFGALATHLDAIGDLWQERRWLFERSRKNALDYLVLVDRP